MKHILVLVLFIPVVAFGQTKSDTLWNSFQPFIGKWSGDSEGQPGKGKYDRTYEAVYNKKFIEVKNKSTYPPSPNKPNGEVHEDHGFISYDKARKTFILRQFHIEGFVIQYKLASITPDKKTIVFVSENIENIPQGYRSKETYQIVSNDEIIEVFELAEPGKDFEIYSKATLRRIK